MRLEPMPPLPAGMIGGLVGGALMPLPAILWSLATRHGLWYPVNLLAGMVVPGMGQLPRRARAISRGMAGDGAGHPRGSVGRLWPGVWSAVAEIAGDSRPRWRGAGCSCRCCGRRSRYSLMGVVNKVLQQEVDWPWFIVSQFVFGIVAAIVVHRSEKIRRSRLKRTRRAGETDGRN